MNEALTQAHRDAAKLKEEVEQRKRENYFLSLELSEWVDEDGKLLTSVKEWIIENFCKSKEGKD